MYKNQSTKFSFVHKNPVTANVKSEEANDVNSTLTARTVRGARYRASTLCGSKSADVSKYPSDCLKQMPQNLRLQCRSHTSFSVLLLLYAVMKSTMVNTCDM